MDGVVYVGGTDGEVYALDAATGDERWRIRTLGAVYWSPAVADGVVYVGSASATLYALDAATGDERWVLHWTQDPRVSSPAVVDDVVYVALAAARSGVDDEADSSKEGPLIRGIYLQSA